MPRTEFLNRTEPLADLAAFLSRAGDGPRVLAITGPSGCGKSALVRQSLALNPAWSLVAVDRAPTPDGMPDPTPLACALADAIEAMAVQEGFPARRSASATARRFFVDGADVVVAVAGRFSRLAAAAKEIRDRLPAAVPSLKPGDPDALYVQSALRSRPCVIHVDHAEGCGNADWSLLAALAANTAVVLLLESASPLPLGSLLAGHRCVQMGLQRLDMSYAEALFASLPGSIGAALAPEFERSGSLRPYAELSGRMHLVEPAAGDRHTFAGDVKSLCRRAVERLDDGDRHFLVAISAHAGGPVPLGRLREFMSGLDAPASTSEVLAAARRLEAGVLVVRSSSGIQVPRVVLEVIDGTRESAARRLYYRKAWRDFYMEPARCGLPAADAERCLQVLRQCVAFKDHVGIAETLEAFAIRGDEPGVVADAARLTRWLVSQFDLKREGPLAAAAAKHLYLAGAFADARDVLASAGPPASRRLRCLMAELYCSAGPFDRGIRLALRELQLAGDANLVDAELCAELVAIHGLRNSDGFAEARERYRAALLKQRYKSRPAYGVLLRFADLCLMRDEDFDDCSRRLEEAAELALRQAQPAEAVSALVALSQHHGYSDLDASAGFLDHAAALAEGSNLERAALLNNRATIALCRGEASQAGLATLEDALILCSDPLDEIIVRNNILVHRSLSGMDCLLPAAELSALLGEEPRDSELRKISAFNLEAALASCEDRQGAARAGAAWRAIDTGIDRTYWRARENGGHPAGVPAWRMSLPFYPVLMSHWKLGTVPFDAIADDV